MCQRGVQVGGDSPKEIVWVGCYCKCDSQETNQSNCKPRGRTRSNLSHWKPNTQWTEGFHHNSNPPGVMSTGPGLGAPDQAEGPHAMGPVGLQTLLDLLVGVYEEFHSSPFAREKYVSGFLQWGECFLISRCLYVFFCIPSSSTSAWLTCEAHWGIPDKLHLSHFIQTPTCWPKWLISLLTVHVAWQTLCLAPDQEQSTGVLPKTHHT